MRVADLSVRKMAALLGVSKSQVDRDKAAGMPMSGPDAARAWRLDKDLSRTADGRIDYVQTSAPKPIPPPAQALLAPGATDASNASVASTGPGKISSPPSEDPEELVDEHAQAYRQDRARNERIKADRAEIELKQLRRELVPVAEIEVLEFTAGRIVRDRLEQLPPRAAADLRAMVLALVPEAQRAAVAAGLELHTFESRLAGLVREALADASKAIEEARRDDDEPD